MGKNSPGKWQYVPIKELYRGLYDGPHATPAPSDSGPIFLGIKNIAEDGSIDLSDIRHIAEEDFPKWTKRVTPQSGDIVFSYEATLHRYALIPPGFRGCLGRRMALIRVNQDRCDYKFLYFYLRSSMWRQVIEAKQVIGATVDRIPLIKFPDFTVLAPEVGTQKTIASILSSYDDLIENNKRRIAILEKMAEEIYREWFVRMRFSSCAPEFAKATSDKKAKVDSTGLPCLPKDIPANLGRISSLRDFATFYKGKNPESTSTEENEDYLPYIMVESLENGQQLFAKKKKNSVIAHHNEILMLMDGARSGLVFRSPEGIVGSTFAVLRTHPLLVNFLFEFLKATQKSIVSNNTGSAIPHANKEFIHRMQVALPEASVLLAFNSVYGPIDLLKANLKLQNEKLVRSRDLLLPRLISGKLSVENLELPSSEKLTAVSSALPEQELAHA